MGILDFLSSPAGGWASPAMPLRYVECQRVTNAGVALGQRVMYKNAIRCIIEDNRNIHRYAGMEPNTGQ